jgi:MFS transporter, PHS family, inorganic phosphate transporter
MLAAVFFTQPLGQLFAGFVWVFVTRQALRADLFGLDTKGCDAQCMSSLDMIWRFTLAVGVLPAMIAITYRLRIPESPRYILEVSNFPGEAASLPDFVGKSRWKSQTYTSSRIWKSSRPRSLEELASGKGPQNRQNRQKAFLHGFRVFMWDNGNWRYLAGTSICWFLLDFAFYGLGMNNPKTLAHIWSSNSFNEMLPAQWSGINGREDSTIYSILREQASQSLMAATLGAVIGCYFLYFWIDHLERRKLQVIGFFSLSLILLLLGVSFSQFAEGKSSTTVPVLYLICQVLFNFGKITTLFKRKKEG